MKTYSENELLDLLLKFGEHIAEKCTGKKLKCIADLYYWWDIYSIKEDIKCKGEDERLKYKHNQKMEVGDFVECIKVNVQAKNNCLTVGAPYEIISIKGAHFEIIDNNGKKRHYKKDNWQFRALL